MAILRFVGPSVQDTSEINVAAGVPAIETSNVPPGASLSYRFNAAGAGVTGNVTDWSNFAFLSFNKTTLATSVWFYYGGSPPASATRFFEYRNQTNLPVCGFRISPAGALQWIYWDGTNTITQLQSVAGVTTGWHRLEMKVTASGTAGSSTLAARFDGVTLTPGASLSLTNAPSGIANVTMGVVPAVTLDMYLGKLVIDDADFPAGDMIKTAIPNGAGSLTTGWTSGTGSTFAEVDENPRDNDTTYIKSSTAGDTRTYAVPDAATLGATGSILAVQPIGFFANEGVAPNAGLRLRSNTTNSDTGGGDPGVSAPTYRIAGKCLTTDPATAAAWTESGFNGVEVGAILGTSVATRCTQLLVAVLSDGKVAGSRSTAAAMGTRFAIAAAPALSLGLTGAMGTRFAVESALSLSLSVAAVARHFHSAEAALSMSLSASGEMGTRYGVAAELAMTLSLTAIILESNPYQRFLPPPGRGAGAALLQGGRGAGAALLQAGRGTIAGAPQPGR
jgi:hypothetical protein